MTFRIPAPGLLVDGRYRLQERIGGGGMGDVFRAEIVEDGRAVAIKFLHPELTEDPELAQRFFQEARAIKQISHPNIVAILDLGIGEVGPYLVMEYLEGEPVGVVLGRLGRLDVESVVAIAIPVLEALEAAHLVGIIHRDLKPENVFIAVSGARDVVAVRLLDFGIAKVLAPTGSAPLTKAGVVFGTPDYLSPEQATGDAPLDGRSDLFAVGVLLYELLTGTRPFCAPTAVATAFRVVHDEAPTIASTGVVVDPRLEALVGRLLQKDPAQRFATARDVARELSDIVPDPAVRAAAIGRILHVERQVRRLGGLPDDPQSEDDTVPAMAPVFEPTTIASPGTDDFQVDAPNHDNGATTQSPGSDRTKRPKRIIPAGGLPTRFAKRFHVRGPVLRAVDVALQDVCGVKAREDVIARMPPDYGDEFSNNTINAMVWYDLDAIHAYMELASAIVVHDMATWREIGRRSVDGELHNSVRTLLRPGDLVSTVKRGISIWSGLFSFGAWRCLTEPILVVHVSDFDPASSPLRLWLIGVVEEITRQATGAEVTVRTFRGELGFTPEFAWELFSLGDGGAGGDGGAKPLA